MPNRLLPPEKAFPLDAGIPPKPKPEALGAPALAKAPNPVGALLVPALARAANPLAANVFAGFDPVPLVLEDPPPVSAPNPVLAPLDAREENPDDPPAEFAKAANPVGAADVASAAKGLEVIGACEVMLPNTEVVGVVVGWDADGLVDPAPNIEDDEDG